MDFPVLKKNGKGLWTPSVKMQVCCRKLELLDMPNETPQNAIDRADVVSGPVSGFKKIAV